MSRSTSCCVTGSAPPSRCRPCAPLRSASERLLAFAYVGPHKRARALDARATKPDHAAVAQFTEEVTEATEYGRTSCMQVAEKWRANNKQLNSLTHQQQDGDARRSSLQVCGPLGTLVCGVCGPARCSQGPGRTEAPKGRPGAVPSPRRPSASGCSKRKS